MSPSGICELGRTLQVGATDLTGGTIAVAIRVAHTALNVDRLADIAVVAHAGFWVKPGVSTGSFAIRNPVRCSICTESRGEALR
jgi:hypothetical protein